MSLQASTSSMILSWSRLSSVPSSRAKRAQSGRFIVLSGLSVIKWIDTYGNAGYTRIFIYGIGTAVLGIIAALTAVYISHKVAKKAGGAAA